MRVQTHSHAGFVAELLAAEHRRTAAEVAEFMLDYAEKHPDADLYDIYDAILKTYKCGEHSEEEGYELR